MAGPNAALLPAKQQGTRAACAWGQAAFTIGAEVADTINVAVQLQDDRGKSVVERVRVQGYLAAAATGADITGTATTSALAIHTNGKLIATPVSGKMFDVISDASGRFDLDIIQTAAPVTYYVVLIKPDGSLFISGAVTFA